MIPSKETLKELSKTVDEWIKEGQSEKEMIESLTQFFNVPEFFAKPLVKGRMGLSQVPARPVEEKVEVQSPEITVSEPLTKQQQAAKDGFKLEDLLEEAIRDRLASKMKLEHLREKQIKESVDSTIHGVDHLIKFKDHIITIQDKWKEKSPKKQEIADFIDDSERISSKLNKPIVLALFVSREEPTKVSIRKFADKNEKFTNSDEVFQFLTAETQDSLVDLVIEKIEYTLEEKGITEHNSKTTEKWSLRPHQIIARQAFNRFCLVVDKPAPVTGIHAHATGAGKTLTGITTANDHFNWAKNNQKNENIIWITERNDVLDTQFFKDGGINFEKFDIWHNSGFIGKIQKDFEFATWHHGRADLESLLKRKSDKPLLLLTTRASLTVGEKYKQMSNLFGGIIYDESHGAGSDQAYEFLKYAVANWKGLEWIQGFSATPVRKQKENIKKLIEIFGENFIGKDGLEKRRLRLFSKYTMIDAIEDEAILPPTFHWIEVKTDKEADNASLMERVYVDQPEIIFDNVEKVLGDCKYRKIIAWTSSIDNADTWKKLFEQLQNRQSDKYPLLNDVDLFISHTGLTKDEQKKNLEKFDTSEGDSMMICVDRFREGSDIKNLDTGIFLDPVNKRGEVPFIQAVGRTLRKGSDEEKTTGHILDSFTLEDKNRRLQKIVELVLGYYLDIKNLEDESDENQDQDKTYQDIEESIDCSEPGKIKIKLKNKTLVFNIVSSSLHTLEWKDLPQEFKLQIKKEIYGESISYEETKKIVAGMNVKSIEEYEQKANQDTRLPLKPREHFNGKWIDWYDFLSLKKSDFYQDIEIVKKIVHENRLNTYKKYREKRHFDPKLPPILGDMFGETVYHNYSQAMGFEEYWE